MLDIKYIKENLAFVKECAQLKHCTADIDALVSLDDRRKKLLTDVEQKKGARNKNNQDVTRLRKEGKDFQPKIEEMKALSDAIKTLDTEIAQIEAKIREIIIMVPNVVHASVPKVDSASGNVVVREWGMKRQFSFKPKDHLDVAEKNGMLDMKRAGKISGSGFGLYMGPGAKLERALINFMLDLHSTKHGYTEVVPPFMVNRDSMFGTGQIPKLEDDMYCTKEDDMFLIPTAEVPVTNIYRDDVLLEKDMPVYYQAYSPCFRREAGSYGKDTRGITRVHQFNKVEMVKFTTPESSYDEHEKLLQNAEDVLQALGLPYRVLLLAAGDMSFSAAKCYDLEVWAPGCERWLEVSSCSNFEDFQARRANIRYRAKDGKVRHVHTLNASGIALPRTFIAILENCQNEDGSITLPEVLAPYLSK